MRLLAVTAIAASLVSGCVAEREYVDAPENPFAFGGGEGSAHVDGRVGQLEDMNGSADSLWVDRVDNDVIFSGNVPHQSRTNSSVYVEVTVRNPDRMRQGEPLQQENLGDDFYALEGDEPAMNVYLCPNGEGESGYAEDVVVTRTGRDTFTFNAIGTNPGQNLDANVDLVAAPR
jgi:hypothetical protein